MTDDERYKAYRKRCHEKQASGKKIYWRTKSGWLKSLARAAKRTKHLRENDKEFKEQERLKARIYYHNNVEKCRKYAEQYWGKYRDELNRERREKRLADPIKARGEWTKSRDNSIGRWIARFNRGEVSIDQLHRRLREHFTRLDEKLGLNGPDDDHDRMRMRKADQGSGEGEA